MARCVCVGEGRGTRETAAEVACVCAGMWAAEEQQQQMRVGPSLTPTSAHGLGRVLRAVWQLGSPLAVQRGKVMADGRNRVAVLLTFSGAVCRTSFK
jgi:hypothetical protein